ncbi:MAG: hypothetical protein GOMPHAMPRED_001252 [Gomphillus americanus]|uniref:Uncharacterized protein n=1 Tax=Gomphillus americanus TaxID=1940652 RepID=A0A8H3F3B4_9LECA|nr:MAG: hypothetical protein GOMPHAMPRED_001252 [Gomphillus americanus]
MASGLVDLSLFAYSPAADQHFSNLSRIEDYRLHTTATWPTMATPSGTIEPQQSAIKQMPRRQRRNIYDLCIPSTGDRCVLRRIKRVKLDTLRGDHRLQLRSAPSAYASAPSAYINPNTIPVQSTQIPTQSLPNQTLQERQTPTEPQPTLPNDNITISGNGVPMIWLSDEQMWLVADPTDPGYGYFATGPEEGIDWLPPYVENDSPSSEPSQSDFSPIREQFMSLMEVSRQDQRPPTINPDEPQMSPLFQEALAGVTMLNFNDSSDYTLPHGTIQPAESRKSSQSGEINTDQAGYTPYNRTNNPWTSRTKRTDSYSRIPRSESPALRNEGHNGKYSTEAEIQRQQERLARRRIMVDHQRHPRDTFNSTNIPYGHGPNYRPSGLSRRESWHSDSCASTTSSLITPEMVWPVRSSSARH